MKRERKTVVLQVDGDLTIPTARAMYRRLKSASRRRDVDAVVVDLAGAGRFDSAGVAVIALGERMLERGGKTLELRHPGEQHEAALALMRRGRAPTEPDGEPPGLLEQVGGAMLDVRDRLVELGALLADVARHAFAVAARRARLPKGAFVEQAVIMGVDALFIVGLLSFLLGTTLAFQGAVQLSRFGAGVFVADLIGVAVVREFAPMMTAIILAGRTGAAIAAELGTMRAGAELDALQAMGVSPIRFLVLPRVGALAVVQPALTLLAMLIGVAGGMVVAALTLDIAPDRFLARIVERVTFGDFVHGLGKSVVFALIIGLTGAFFGLRTSGAASAVGAATTRTVVVCVTLVLCVDAMFATVSSLTNYGAPP